MKFDLLAQVFNEKLNEHNYNVAELALETKSKVGRWQRVRGKRCKLTPASLEMLVSVFPIQDLLELCVVSATTETARLTLPSQANMLKEKYDLWLAQQITAHNLHEFSTEAEGIVRNRIYELRHLWSPIKPTPAPLHPHTYLKGLLQRKNITRRMLLLSDSSTVAKQSISSLDRGIHAKMTVEAAIWWSEAVPSVTAEQLLDLQTRIELHFKRRKLNKEGIC